MNEPLKIGDIVQAAKLPERDLGGSIVLNAGPAFDLAPLVFVDKDADDVHVFDDMPHSHAEVVGHVDNVAPYQAHYSAWQVQHEKWLAKNGRSA